MISYPSYIDGHSISCKPLPTWNDTGVYKKDAQQMERLIKLPIQGSGQPTHTHKTLNVWAGGKHIEKDRVFYLGKNFEYYDGQMSLTQVLLIHRQLSETEIKVQIR